MARDWARKKVEPVRKAGGDVHYLSWVLYERDALKLLKAERTRARRVVSGYRKEMQETIIKDSDMKVWRAAKLNACDDLLRRLQ